jgi:hypothetical protein
LSAKQVIYPAKWKRDDRQRKMERSIFTTNRIGMTKTRTADSEALTKAIFLFITKPECEYPLSSKTKKPFHL